MFYLHATKNKGRVSSRMIVDQLKHIHTTYKQIKSKKLVTDRYTYIQGEIIELLFSKSYSARRLYGHLRERDW